MRGEGFAFFHWRIQSNLAGCSQRMALSMWGEVQRRAYYRIVLAGKRK